MNCPNCALRDDCPDRIAADADHRLVYACAQAVADDGSLIEGER